MTGRPAGEVSPGRLVCAGVDEAGRGCIIGPLVVAGVAFTASHDADAAGDSCLQRLGSKDSKLLSSQQRERIHQELLAWCDGVEEQSESASKRRPAPPREPGEPEAGALVLEAAAEGRVQWYIHHVSISAQAIDRGNINTLEKEAIVQICERLRPHRLVVDMPVAPSGEGAFRASLVQLLGALAPAELVLENRADANHPIVAAASVVAKVVRDNEIARLHKLLGDFGSGYPSDPRTRHFLQANWDSSSSLRSHVRTRWGTMDKLGLRQGLLPLA